MPRPKFLAVAHLKGGSGATTVAVNLAAGMALRGRRVLLLDLDPVAASTFHLIEETPERTLADVLEGRRDLAQVLVATPVDGLTLAPGDSRLAAWDRKPERFPVDLSRVFSQVPKGIEYLITDLPPSAGAIVRGTLAILPGGAILAPIQTRALDLVGFADMLALVEDLQEQNPTLHVAGIVPVRTNRTNLSAEVVDALRKEHKGKVLPGIRDSVVVAQAPLRNRPLQLTARRSKAAEDFSRLTRAVLALKI